jgi:hypothetical protein
MTGRNAQERNGLTPVSRLLFSLSLTIALPTVAPARADEGCTYQGAYSVDGGRVQRQGDTLIVDVWGRAPNGGWTNPKLALMPDDSNPIAVSYRLIGCAPDHETGGLEPMRARAFIVANPGRIRTILVRAATNDMRFQGDPGQ